MDGPLQFQIIAKCGRSKARAAILTLPHSQVATPVFMPVGTQGTLKGILSEQLQSIDCNIMLCNTYHLAHRPGHELVRNAGGLHKFINWPRSLLTDSGGFQMVSLSELATVTENGVDFTSPHTGEPMTLTPEESIRIQNALGADIIMQLDDVVPALTQSRDRVREAMQRSIRWLDRCIAAHSRTADQSLFPIIQGGLDEQLRNECLSAMIQRTAAGFAIGGLSGGEAKHSFWRIVSLCTDRLPVDKPRYVMGVGHAIDLVVCVALGADMFDCVFPTRTARFGTALVAGGQLRLKSNQYADDFEPIDVNCPCTTCQRRYTRAYLHSIVTRETVACHLLSIHNICYQIQLMSSMHNAIRLNQFDIWIRGFVAEQYASREDIPGWVNDALASVGIVI